MVFKLTFSVVFLIFSVTWVYSEDLIHVVGRGDTVYSISRLFGVSVDDLMTANNITDPSRLQIGTRIKIPAAEADTPAPVPAANTQALENYRVVRGDTLFGIARRNDITLANLLEINRLSSNHVIKVGDIIKVPARSAENVPVATPQTPAPTVSESIYSLRWPVNPKEITYMTGDTGVIVEGEVNESVRSLTQGNVISAGPWRKFGRVVVIESQEYFYMYGGCETLSVSVGDKVSPGTELGRLGINTVSDKPQLFFMVFRSETPIDPAIAPRTGGRI